MPETVYPVYAPAKYRAFISYSHADRDFAEKFHRWLETYSFHPELVGKPARFGPVPQRWKPVCRDREDFESGHSLSDQVKKALEESETVIVICSPNAAASAHVNDEIRAFKAMGKGAYIYPIIIDGEPKDPAQDCFPKALRRKIGSDGQLTDDPEEPVAADARPIGDGLELARLKVLSGALGVDLDDLRRRDAEEQRRQKMFWLRLSVFMGVLAVAALVAAGFAGFFFYERGIALQKSDQLVSISLKYTSKIVRKAIATTNEFGVPTQVGIDLMKEVGGIFDEMGDAEQGIKTPGEGDAVLLVPSADRLPIGRARMFIALADAFGRLGKIGEQQDHAKNAVGLMTDGLTEPAGKLVLHTKAEALVQLGDAYSSRHEINTALIQYQEALDIRLKHLDGLAAPNVEWLAALAGCYGKISRAYNARGEIDEALAYALKGFAVAERLAVLPGGNEVAEEQQVEAFIQIADLERQISRTNPKALNQANQAMKMIDRVLADLPENVWWLRKKAHVLIILGDIRLRQESLKSYNEAYAIREKLNKADPQNTFIEIDVLFARIKKGEALKSLGPEFLDQAEAELNLARLALETILKANPDRQVAALRLLDALDGLGDVRLERTDYPGMRVIYERKLGVAQSLLNSDPNNRHAQRAIAQARIKIGDSHRKEKQLDIAIGIYEKARDELRILAEGDPRNLKDAQTFGRSLEELGLAFLEVEKYQEAQKSFEEALKYRQRIANTRRNATGPKLQTAWVRTRLAMAKLELGDKEGALPLAEEAIKIREGYWKPSPEDPKKDVLLGESKTEQAIAHETVGRIKLAASDFDGAIAAFQQGIFIRTLLDDKDREGTAQRGAMGEAERLIGEAYRGKKDCAAASAAYTRAREHYRVATAQESGETDWAQTLQTLEQAILDEDAKCGFAPPPASPAPEPNAPEKLPDPEGQPL